MKSFCRVRIGISLHPNAALKTVAALHCATSVNEHATKDAAVQADFAEADYATVASC